MKIKKIKLNEHDRHKLMKKFLHTFSSIFFAFLHMGFRIKMMRMEISDYNKKSNTVYKNQLHGQWPKDLVMDKRLGEEEKIARNTLIQC